MQPCTDESTALMAAFLLGFHQKLQGPDDPLVHHLAYLVGEWLLFKPRWRDLSVMMRAGQLSATRYLQ